MLGRTESEKKQLQLRLGREETERGEEKRELENRTTELREQVLRLESFLEQTKKERESYSNRYRIVLGDDLKSVTCKFSFITTLTSYSNDLFQRYIICPIIHECAFGFNFLNLMV